MFKTLFIIQHRNKLDSFKIKYQETRINPYNPLSYLVIIIAIIYSIFKYGIVGCWDYLSLKDIFKYT